MLFIQRPRFNVPSVPYAKLALENLTLLKYATLGILLIFWKKYISPIFSITKRKKVEEFPIEKNKPYYVYSACLYTTYTMYCILYSLITTSKPSTSLLSEPDMIN